MSLKDARLPSLREKLEKVETAEPEIVENEEVEKPKGRITSKKK